MCMYLCMHMYVCMYIHVLFVYMYVCTVCMYTWATTLSHVCEFTFTCISVCLPISPARNLSVCLSVCPSICVSVSIPTSVRQSVCPSIHALVPRSVHLSVLPWVPPSVRLMSELPSCSSDTVPRASQMDSPHGHPLLSSHPHVLPLQYSPLTSPLLHSPLSFALSLDSHQAANWNPYFFGWVGGNVRPASLVMSSIWESVWHGGHSLAVTPYKTAYGLY